MSKFRGLTKAALMWICVGCAIVAVLNIPDRMTYEGIQTASAMITAKTDLVESELAYLNIVSSCTDIYDPSGYQSFHLVRVEDIENTDGTITKVENTYCIMMLESAFDSPQDAKLVTEPLYIDPSDVPKIKSMLFFLSHSGATQFTFNYAVNLICFYASALLNIFFDSLPVIFSVLRAVLYLIGIG